MNRRAFLTTTAAAATAVTMKAAAAATVTPFGQTGAPTRSTAPLPLGPLPGSRYPDSRLESLKKPPVSFGPSGFPAFAGTMAVERVATGFRWAEGPVYFPAGRYVLFSDIPNNRIMRFSEDDGHVSVYRHPSMNSNGNTIDREGRLITCEHSGRRVTRTELDGSITIIADKYQWQEAQLAERRGRRGRRFDLVLRSGLRHRRFLRGHQGRSRAGQAQRLPRGSEIR